MNETLEKAIRRLRRAIWYFQVAEEIGSEKIKAEATADVKEAKALLDAFLG